MLSLLQQVTIKPSISQELFMVFSKFFQSMPAWRARFSSVSTLKGSKVVERHGHLSAPYRVIFTKRFSEYSELKSY